MFSISLITIFLTVTTAVIETIRLVMTPIFQLVTMLVDAFFPTSTTPTATVIIIRAL
jgi:hypothetical protein